MWQTAKGPTLRCAMHADDVIGLVLAVVVLAYLVYALIVPERLG